MNKELQDKTWAALPKEAKEEVKLYYDESVDWGHDVLALEYLFGEHNLTSDANEEPKPAKLKYKYCIGQKVKSAYADEVLTIKEHCGCVGNDNIYRVEEYDYTWNVCELNPYEEPEKEDLKMVKCTDRRLMIAAMAMLGMLTRIDDTP